MKIYLTIAFALVSAFSIFGQQTVLVNSDVVELAKSGLSTEIVVAKIRASETKFDTSTFALKALTEAQVPDAIIVVMLEKEQKRQESASTSQKLSDETRNSIAEQGTLEDIMGKKKVFIMVNDVKSRDNIAKELAKSDLIVVDKIEDSDFAFKYDDYIEDLGATVTVQGNTANAQPRSQRVGTLTVIMPAQTGNRIRLIYSSTKTEYWRWDSHPSKSATKQFLKDLAKISAGKR